MEATTEDNSFILDGIRWSYSSVNTFAQCPKGFKLAYIDALPRAENAFAQWGTLAHSLLERYFKGALEFYELLQEYKDDYSEAVTCSFPPNAHVDLGKKYHARGIEYFSEFDGSDFDNYEVIAVEEQVFLDIGGRPFVGVIDLLVKEGDEYIVIDHKSKAKFKSKKERDEYLRQLYIYSLYVKEKYGKYPKKLIFNMFRAGEFVTEEFQLEKLESAVKWFLENIEKIYSATSFDATPDAFFCDWLCSCRIYCACSNDYREEISQEVE